MGRASVVTYVVEVEPPRHVAAATSDPQLEGDVPTQTGFSPDQPENNMSSLSIDLVNLRERWLVVYDYSYVDDREPEASNDYAGVPGSRQKRIGPGHHRKTHAWRRHGSHWLRP